jgi:hypothetical protein
MSPVVDEITAELLRQEGNKLGSEIHRIIDPILVIKNSHCSGATYHCTYL